MYKKINVTYDFDDGPPFVTWKIDSEATTTAVQAGYIPNAINSKKLDGQNSSYYLDNSWWALSTSTWLFNNSNTLDFNETKLNSSYVPYSGAIKNVDLGIYNLTTTGMGQFSYVDKLEITSPGTPPANTLRLSVKDYKGFSVYEFIDDTGMSRRLVRDNVFIGKNTGVSNISAMSAVYDCGSSGNVPSLCLAKSDSISTMPAIGITIEQINTDSFGRVMMVGLLEKINTDSFTEGNTIYVSDTVAGGLTDVAPITPNLTQEMGTVLVKSIGSGSIQIVSRALTGDEYGTAQNTFVIGNGTASNKVLSFNAVTDGTITWNGTSFVFNGDGLFTNLFSDSWTNVTITEAQISDLSHTVDTNTNCSSDGSCPLIVYASNVTNWDTDTSDDVNTTTQFAGDVTGTFDATVVADDTHNHSILNITGLDTNACSGTDKVKNVTFDNGNLVIVCDTDNSASVGTDEIGDTEMNYTEVTLNDFTNDANFITNVTMNKTVYETDISGIVDCNDETETLLYNSSDNLFYCGTDNSASVGADEIGDTEMNYTEVTLTDFTNDAGYFDDIANFTGTLTGGKICTYDSTNTIINCTTDPSGVGADAIGDTEMNYTEVTLADFTDDVGFVKNRTDINATTVYSDDWTNISITISQITDENWAEDSQVVNTTTTFGGEVSGTYDAIALVDYALLVDWANLSNVPSGLSGTVNTTTNLAGDVTGTYDATVVADDSHDHDWANITNAPTFVSNRTDANLTAIYSDDWSNITALASQISDLVTSIGNWSLDKASYAPNSQVVNKTTTFGGEVSGTYDALSLVDYSILSDWANISNTPTFVANRTDANLTAVYSDDWTNISITESQVSDADWWDADADIDNDEIAEGKINFTTTCAQGSYFYVSSWDLVCATLDDSHTHDAANITNAPWIENRTDANLTAVYSDDWTNISITESQISDLTAVKNRTDANLTAVYSDDWSNITALASQISDLVTSIGNWSLDKASYAPNSQVVNKTTNFVGDVTGTYDATVVGDASHLHNAENISAGSFGTGNFVYDGVVQLENITFEKDSTNHKIYDNTTCVVITGDTSTLTIC
jgi:hypothetical protein